MFEWVVSVIEGWGYPGVFLLMLAENLFPPIPSEVIMPLAGFLVGQLLGMEPALCQQILLLLWRQGCLQAIAPGVLGEAAAVAPAASDPTPTTPAGSFIVRLWRRLAGLGQH